MSTSSGALAAASDDEGLLPTALYGSGDDSADGSDATDGRTPDDVYAQDDGDEEPSTSGAHAHAQQPAPRSPAGWPAAVMQPQLRMRIQHPLPASCSACAYSLHACASACAHGARLTPLSHQPLQRHSMALHPHTSPAQRERPPLLPPFPPPPSHTHMYA